MAGERKRPQKSETLTIRLDPKMRFALEFIARIKGQTITTVIERAIKSQADVTRVGEGNYDERRSWSEYWSVNDGVRAIKIALDPELHPTFDDDLLIEMVRANWEFFSLSPDLRSLRDLSIAILWPHIKDLVELWRETRSSDPWAVGMAMKKILSGAKIKSPDWPRRERSAPPREVELDDEIPF